LALGASKGKVGIAMSIHSHAVDTGQGLPDSAHIPQAFASLPNSGAVDDIFVFTNFNQGNVLASAPIPAGRPTPPPTTRRCGKSTR
jgi:hypothetical protein